MGEDVIARDGRWKLTRKDDGIFIIHDRNGPRAKVVTPDYDQEGGKDERTSMMLEVIELDGKDPEQAFRDYVMGRDEDGFLTRL